MVGDPQRFETVLKAVGYNRATGVILHLKRWLSSRPRLSQQQDVGRSRCRTSHAVSVTAQEDGSPTRNSRRRNADVGTGGTETALNRTYETPTQWE